MNYVGPTHVGFLLTQRSALLVGARTYGLVWQKIQEPLILANYALQEGCLMSSAWKRPPRFVCFDTDSCSWPLAWLRFPVDLDLSRRINHWLPRYNRHHVPRSANMLLLSSTGSRRLLVVYISISTLNLNAVQPSQIMYISISLSWAALTGHVSRPECWPTSHWRLPMG